MKRLVLALVCALLPEWSALAMEAFQVKDIRVEGLQRIAPGTVFNYLPIKVGDTATEKSIQDAIRALHKTGFFKDVRLERQAAVLIVSVVERPSIGSVRILGTKEFSEDDLKKGLKELGLAEGRVFNRSLLDRIEQEMRQQYFSKGFYAVVIKPTVTPLERNRVDVTLDVAEGSPARIREVNFVGNNVFDDDELGDLLTQGPRSWWAVFSSRDQYSKQKLAGDLERLRNHYQDRGYLEFAIDSTQVTITPSKERLYVTANLTEGKKYSITGYKLAGQFVVPEEELKQLVDIKSGDVFSRKRITETSKKLTDRLTNEGYAFANVNAVPDVNRDKSEVFFTFFIDPGKRTYIRRVNFAGNVTTRDEVIRREMRQLEGSVYAADKIQRSRVRLQRLGFFDDVNIETPAVPGTADQVDVNITVKERQTGNLLLGIGYSDADGFLFNASVAQRNLFGTGNELAVTYDNSKSFTNFNIRYVDPFYTPEGVSRGFNVFSQTVDAAEANTAAYNTETRGAGIFYSIPLTEDNRINLGGDYENIDILTNSESAQVAQDFVAKYGPTNDIFKVTVGWSHDTLDSFLQPTQGGFRRINLETAIPSSDIEYYKATLQLGQYWPLTEQLTFKARAELGYGDGYGGTDELPFYKNFYAGGSSSVRGYESRSLGPRDTGPSNDPIGGNKRALVNTELLFPMPGQPADAKSMRLSIFMDGGMAFGDTERLGLGELRYSTGLAFNWFSPVGPLSFSYAIPLNAKETDEIERFQFTLGVPFR
jgi:outer membrane protein insertion porin family